MAATMEAMMNIVCMSISFSIARGQLELSRIRERGSFQPRHEEWCEPLQQQLVIVLFDRGHLREELQCVGARERIGKRAHHEMKAPRELLARQVRQRLQERFLVEPDHVAVLRGKKMADEGRGVRIRASQKPQEVLAPALLVA